MRRVDYLNLNFIAIIINQSALYFLRFKLKQKLLSIFHSESIAFLCWRTRKTSLLVPTFSRHKTNWIKNKYFYYKGCAGDPGAKRNYYFTLCSLFVSSTYLSELRFHPDCLGFVCFMKLQRYVLQPCLSNSTTLPTKAILNCHMNFEKKRDNPFPIHGLPHRIFTKMKLDLCVRV